MGYEVDFLPVGDLSKGGDAIALRYGNLYGPRDQQTVIVIDGGYRDDGEALVEHIDRYFETDDVDFVVSTHPDLDHISGLQVVLEEMTVGTLLMHVPEFHDRALGSASTFEQKSASLGEYAAKSLAQSYNLYDLARRKRVEVREPFAGMHTNDGFRILGPTRDYYDELLREMQGGRSLAGSLSHKEALLKTSSGPIGVASEDLYTETLTEESLTTASNNSSVISMLELDGRRLLFTGDAGEEALRPVVDQLRAEGVIPGRFKLVQIPHHGSRKNVTPKILDELLGPATTEKRGSAFASVPRNNPEHKFPSKQTTNAFLRRGYPVVATAGSTKRSHQDAPDRGWSSASTIPFHDRVEQFDD